MNVEVILAAWKLFEYKIFEYVASVSHEVVMFGIAFIIELSSDKWLIFLIALMHAINYFNRALTR